jgi:geranylgeranyl reductase
MKFYEELAEMYVGDDVSPDFYGWVFPKYDHVGVGTGTVVNRPEIKKYQKGKIFWIKFSLILSLNVSNFLR